MEQWQGLAPEVKEAYSVIHVIKRTAEKELVLLQSKTDETRILLRNYPGEISAVYQLLVGKDVENIPRILATQQRENGYYVLEEFIEGQALAEIALSSRDALEVLRQLCKALSALHVLGIVHRDIKPEHLLQTAEGKFYLIDLDAARLYKIHIDKDTCMLGTTGFAAPEQFGIVQTDHRADIFALGVTFNVLLTGCHPSKQLCTGWFRHIVLKCTRIDPKARYQTASAVWHAALPIRCLFAWKGFGRARHFLALGTCATLCTACVVLLNEALHPQPLPVTELPKSSSALSGSLSASSFSNDSSGSASASLSISQSHSHSASYSVSDSASASRSQQSSSDSLSDSSSHTDSSSSANAGPGIDAGQSNPSSSSRPSTSGTSSESSGSSKPSTSSKPSSSSSKPSSSSSKPSSSSSSSAPPSPQEQEIRKAIAEYTTLKAEYDRIHALHSQSYQEYEALYGYELSKIETKRELAQREANIARQSAAEAQARADAYGAQNPPDLEAQAQAQAEADSYNQQAAQKDQEVEAYNAEWSAYYERPEVQEAYWKFTDYAVQGNAISGQLTAAKNRIDYLQNLYGIYLM